MLRPRSSRLAAGLVALTLLLAACGGDDGDSTSSGDTTADAGTDAGDDGTGGERAEVPDDVCALVTAEQVAAVTGEAGVIAEDVPGGGCRYPGEDVRNTVAPTISIAEDVAGAGGITAAQMGAEAALGGTAEAITVDGAPGYLISGEVMGFSSTQAAVAHDGLIITVGVNGSDPANAQRAEQLLQITLDAL